MKGALLAVVACCLVALPASAGTGSVERVSLASSPLTAGFPPRTAVQLASPPGYARQTLDGSHGTWVGPEYRASGNSADSGNVAISWTVEFTQAKDARAAAWAGLRRGWSYRRKDPIAIPHVAGGRVLGTIDGFTILTQGPDSANASYEGALAFPVAQGTFAVERFVIEAPPSDSAGANGTYLVNGSVKPSVWAYGQMFWAFSGVALAGALPPKNVTAKRAGRILHGAVVDTFRHPVREALITLQRFVKRSWQRVGTAHTDRAGRYELRVRKKGVYRVEARLGKTAVVSLAVSF